MSNMANEEKSLYNEKMKIHPLRSLVILIVHGRLKIEKGIFLMLSKCGAGGGDDRLKYTPRHVEKG